jgi:hypothetical protein
MAHPDGLGGTPVAHHWNRRMQDFQQNLNSIHMNIKFTMEMEENGRRPFLDVLTN